MKLHTNSVQVEGSSDVNGCAVESDRSNTSHEEDTVGHDTSEDDVDSDDSSEMDEGECECRRVQLIRHVHDLEQQFSVLREQLYQERVAQVELQLNDVKAGRSPDYLVPLAELQEAMRVRTEVAGILRCLRLENVRNQFEAEEQAAKQNLESEKQLACDFYYTELMETIRRLEEDRHNSEITWGEWGISGAGSGGGRLLGNRAKSRKKAVTVSGPYIVYMLNPQDIMEDWAIIRKSLQRTH